MQPQRTIDSGQPVAVEDESLADEADFGIRSGVEKLIGAQDGVARAMCGIDGVGIDRDDNLPRLRVGVELDGRRNLLEATMHVGDVEMTYGKIDCQMIGIDAPVGGVARSRQREEPGAGEQRTEASKRWEHEVYMPTVLSRAAFHREHSRASLPVPSRAPRFPSRRIQTAPATAPPPASWSGSAALRPGEPRIGCRAAGDHAWGKGRPPARPAPVAGPAPATPGARFRDSNGTFPAPQLRCRGRAAGSSARDCARGRGSAPWENGGARVLPSSPTPRLRRSPARRASR